MAVAKIKDPLATVDAMAKLLDSQFKIPGTNIRFGLDAIAGLIPFGGDAASFVASSALVLTMVRHGASGMVVLRMLINIAVDAVLGSVPLIGDLFDVAFKANDRNVQLLREQYEQGKHTGNVWPLLIVTLVVLIGLFGLLLWLLISVYQWLAAYFDAA